MKNKYLFSCVLTLLLFSGVSLSKEFIPVEVFATLPQFRDVEISPDGTKLALFANLKNGYGVILDDIIAGIYSILTLMIFNVFI